MRPLLTTSWSMTGRTARKSFHVFLDVTKGAPLALLHPFCLITQRCFGFIAEAFHRSFDAR